MRNHRFRGIYACGVPDYCLDQNIRFDLGIGISAGSANLVSFDSQNANSISRRRPLNDEKQYPEVIVELENDTLQISNAE